MMHDNGERDPLDGWLSQQVQPLPPPPGTFELITRRARRRKIRKLAVTVASAAAVAAAVAVAVPDGLVLHLPSSQVTSQPVAQGGKPTPSAGGSQSANGSASHVPTPTVSPTTTGSGPTEPAGPVPPNFQPSSVTFVDTHHAWVIGQAGTPGHCADANPYYCTSVARTDDAGKTWEGGPAPKTGPPSGASGVSGIRFLEGMNGWAFGPQLWATHDAGNSWHQVATADGYRVTDLETVNHRAYALFADCSGSAGADFAAGCTKYTLMTTAADSDDWVAVGAATSGLTADGAPTSAMLAVTGSTGYLVAPDGTLYSGPVGGVWTKAGPVGCQPGPAQANGLPSRALLALRDSTHVAVACAGSGLGGVTIYTSSDRGVNWTQQPAAAWSGVDHPAVATSFTDAVNGTLVLAWSGGLDVLPAGGSQWTQAIAPPQAPQGGFSYVGMTNSLQGVAVPANTGLHEIWMTFDGGTTWAPTAPIASS